MTPLNTIFTWFETGDFPTETQFKQTFSSFFHKESLIPVASIEGITQMFQNTASAQALANHLLDANAHSGSVAKRDSSNLSAANIAAWKNSLGLNNKADLVNGKVPISQLPAINGGGIEVYVGEITDLTVGEKIITHDLDTENYLVKFTDKIAKEPIEVRNFPFGNNNIKIINDIPFTNEIDVLIIKII